METVFGAKSWKMSNFMVFVGPQIQDYYCFQWPMAKFTSTMAWEVLYPKWTFNVYLIQVQPIIKLLHCIGTAENMVLFIEMHQPWLYVMIMAECKSWEMKTTKVSIWPQKKRCSKPKPNLIFFSLDWPVTENQILIACKSDPARLPKSWFSVNNITEKLRPVLPF